MHEVVKSKIELAKEISNGQRYLMRSPRSYHSADLHVF